MHGGETMSEIDPWALPQSGPTATTAGIPPQYSPYPYPLPGPIQPLSRVLPILAMTLGTLYVIATIVEIFIINSQVSLMNTLTADVNSGTVPDDALTQIQNSDHQISTGSLITGGIYLAAFLTIIVWERRLKTQLGSTGARRAVFAKAGYTYFRAAWMLSIILSVFLTSQSNAANITTPQDAANHDHELMLYFGLRAVVGAVLVFFAYRLMKMSNEGVHRLLAVAAR